MEDRFGAVCRCLCGCLSFHTSSNEFADWADCHDAALLASLLWTLPAAGPEDCGGEGGEPTENHFHATLKLVEIGSGGRRNVGDWFLDRYACYLIAMNGDPTARPEIADAQRYFAIQTRRQEIADRESTESERIEWRERLRDATKGLNSAAKGSGVQNYAIW